MTRVHLYDYGLCRLVWLGAIEDVHGDEIFGAIQPERSDTVPLNTVDQMAGFVVKRKKGEIKIMAQVEVPINGIDPDYRSQLEYALSFADEEIVSYRINDATLDHRSGSFAGKADHESVTRKIRELVQAL